MMDEQTKADLAERLFKYLNDNLDPTVKAGISSIQMREILHGVADWIDESQYIQKIAKGMTDQANNDNSTEDFLADLSKL